MQLQRPQGGHDDGSRRTQAGHPALDVEELLRAQIAAEARFGDDVIGKAESECVGDNRAAAVCDVAKGTGVDERRRALRGLHQVGVHGVPKEGGHGSSTPQVLGVHRPSVLHHPHENPPEPPPQVLQIGGQREDRHHLRGFGDHELAAPAALQSHLAQLPVVQPHDQRPIDRVGIELKRVAVRQMVANERGQQVMRRGHRVCISGQMEIHFFLRDDLRAPAAGTASLDTEHGTETGLAQRHEGAETQPTQAHGQPDRGDGLPFAQRCGVDGGDQHVAAERSAAEPIERGQRDLALVAAVGLDLVSLQSGLGGDRFDGMEYGFLGDLKA